MKTLKEIQEHFKFAKEVKCLETGLIFKIKKNTIIKNYLLVNYIIIDSKYNVKFFICKDNLFAEIISYKDKLIIK